MDYAAGKTDDRGESLADFYLDQSEGQAGGAALPAGAAEVRKAQVALRRRQKDAYAYMRGRDGPSVASRQGSHLRSDAIPRHEDEAISRDTNARRQ